MMYKKRNVKTFMPRGVPAITSAKIPNINVDIMLNISSLVLSQKYIPE